MSQTRDMDRKNRPLARAICEFENGEKRRLYATSLSLSRAFLLSMSPRKAGENVRVTLCPHGFAPLPPIDARIVSVHLRPDAPMQTGFDVVFRELDEKTHTLLSAALTTFGVEPLAGAPVIVERRQYPRVWTDAIAVVHLPHGPRRVRVLNVSMTGALLAFGPEPPPDRIEPGDVLSIQILSPSTPEDFSIRGKVVRLTAGAEPKGFTVQFVGLLDLERARLEGFILGVLTGED